MQHDYDYIIVGSGFGGSVSALRLSEKGYRVLVIEKGKRWNSNDYPKTNWNLKRWLWLPVFRFRGFFKLTIMRHVSILSGVGVGGGSLTYANTLPRPRETFFNSGSWAGLLDWKDELEAHYLEAERMLGATENPGSYDSDEALKAVAGKYGKEGSFEPTRVAVFFGEPEEEVPDPYFEGKGPRRSGCNFCGSCMTGCPHNAKNTLDKNYLYFAEKQGCELIPEQRVYRIRDIKTANGREGYEVYLKNTFGLFRSRRKLTAGGLILSGGVLGTVRLLLNMNKRYLKDLSPRLGDQIRTNNESLALVHSRFREKDFSRGVAIGSIFPPDKDTHLEAVRYGSGSGFWKLMAVPITHGKTMAGRILKLVWSFLSSPRKWFRMWFSKDFAKESVILLFMQHLDSTLSLRRSKFNLLSRLEDGEAPSASMPLAKELAEVTAEEVWGDPYVMNAEAVLGTPLTAHILGGCVIGESADQGVIDTGHRVHGYENLYVCDGSAISANPGVNPALTITAMTERAMSQIPEKDKLNNSTPI